MTRAIFVNSDTCKLKPAILIHLVAPIPVYPKNNVVIKPIKTKIKKISAILKINFGSNMITKKNKGRKNKNLINWFDAHGSREPPAAE